MQRVLDRCCDISRLSIHLTTVVHFCQSLFIYFELYVVYFELNVVYFELYVVYFELYVVYFELNVLV